MEACATSHYWARELTKFGHIVKLMPPAYVKPYVKRGKNDADAEAICEAVTRPNMGIPRQAQSREIRIGGKLGEMAGVLDGADRARLIRKLECGDRLDYHDRQFDRRTHQPPANGGRRVEPKLGGQGVFAC
jgi:transposase